MDEAKTIVKELEDISFYKVGLVLYLIGGKEFIEWLISQDKKVFLDLKLYDIPATIEKAVKEISKLDIEFLTIYGDKEIIKAAVKSKGDLKLLSLTVLTSRQENDLVKQRVKDAINYGSDGVISSPNEIETIRELSNDLIIVTPGIRRHKDLQNDHKRSATPSQAIKKGADYIVIGRPILEAKDRNKEAKEIITSLKGET